VALDPQSIARHDFPTAAGGYDPVAVDAHLTAVAAEVEEALRRAAAGDDQALRARVDAAGSDLRRLLALLAEAAGQVETALRTLYGEAFVAGGGAAGEVSPALGVTVGEVAAAAGDEEVGEEPALAAVDEAPAEDAPAEQG
jgi:DivIVA domain-containing protein